MSRVGVDGDEVGAGGGTVAAHIAAALAATIKRGGTLETQK